ncbi:MAG: TraR/DksA family transcriptional regulator [Candidatus Phosphoribacter sp.]|nr:TraR/DksA family transcriptional regulator [Actinomycetales bacterium]
MAATKGKPAGSAGTAPAAAPATAARASAKAPATAKKAPAPGKEAPATAKKAPAPAKEAPATAKKAPAAGKKPRIAAPPVRADEKPWTQAELAEIRRDIERDILRGMADIRTAEEDLQGLIWDAGDGSGDDQADAGAKTYEREQEISLANISRDKLAQNRHALERLDSGSYGVCESCGEAIGKFRLQAAPRATLCRSCKEKAERG